MVYAYTIQKGGENVPTKKIMKDRARTLLWREIEKLYKLTDNYHNYRSQLKRVQSMSYLAYHTGLLGESAYIEILHLCGVAYGKESNGKISDINFENS